MDIAKRAFQELFPERNISEYEFLIRYSGRFSDYNAHVTYRGNRLAFSLSKKWKGVSEEILLGLFQTLLVKVYKKKITTMSMDLYNLFLKNVHIAAPKHTIDPFLKT